METIELIGIRLILENCYPTGIRSENDVVCRQVMLATITTHAAPVADYQNHRHCLYRAERSFETTLNRFKESLSGSKSAMGQNSIPLELPARRKAAMHLMIPNTSWVKISWTLPCVASGLSRHNREPWATIISCCFFPLKDPRMACVTAEGWRMESEYMNILEPPDIVKVEAPKRLGPADWV